MDLAVRKGGPEAADYLSRTVGADDVPSATIARAADGLADRAEEVDLARMRTLLTDPASARRAAAVRVLLAHDALEDPEAIERAVHDESAFVRAECVPLLGDARHRPLALALLDDPDHLVRARAVAALRGVRDSTAVSAVRDRLGDESYRVRAAAVGCLASAGHRDDVLALADDPALGVRLAVRQALGTP